MTQSFEKNMSEAAAGLGIQLDEMKLSQLYTYYEMLVEKNKVMNLTGITEESDVIIKHFADSLSIVRAVDLMKMSDESEHIRLIDVGTGAGFPGLVLKIVFPELNVTLFDSLNKRLVFLNEVIAALSLTGVETVHGRAEDYGHNASYRKKFDIAVSRAVANMSTLLEYCLPFVKNNGMFIAYKSVESDDEISSAGAAMNILGGRIIKKDDFKLPGTDIDRCLITVAKVKETPKKYPRKAGLPSSEPLK